MKILLWLTIIVTCSVNVVWSQVYSEDLNDLQSLNNAIRPIGDLGKLESVVDLRGFMPLSGRSKRKDTRKDKGIEFKDRLQYYKVPITQAIAYVYYGSNSVSIMKDVPFIQEREVTGESEVWAKLAYKLAKGGKNLYQSVGGGVGFNSAEPVAVLFTENTTIVVLNFRYSLLALQGTGQYLVAFEFSRKLKEYKSFYPIYYTFAFAPSIRDAFSKSAPYVAQLLIGL